MPATYSQYQYSAHPRIISSGAISSIYNHRSDSNRRPYRPEEGIRHSYADTTRSSVTPSGIGKPLRYGDRLFVRLVMGGRTLLNCMINRVNDLTELYGEIRHLTQGIKGLCTLHLRNASRGWSMEKPIKLYGPLCGPAAVKAAPVRVSEQVRSASPGMLCPWETH